MRDVRDTDYNRGSLRDEYSYKGRNSTSRSPSRGSHDQHDSSRAPRQSAEERLKQQYADNSGAVGAASDIDEPELRLDEDVDFGDLTGFGQDEDAEAQAAEQRRLRRAALLRQATPPTQEQQSTSAAAAASKFAPKQAEQPSQQAAQPSVIKRSDTVTHIGAMHNDAAFDDVAAPAPTADHDTVDGTEHPVKIDASMTSQSAAVAVNDDDDDLDMFNTSPSAMRATLPAATAAHLTAPVGATTTPSTNASSANPAAAAAGGDNTTSDGFYQFRVNDALGDDGRYVVTAYQGSGVFSTVLRATDTKATSDEQRDVAIKVIRSNDTMRKAGANELALLQQLSKDDPHQRKHIVQLRSTFVHHTHLCLVFEPLYMDLRRLIKKFGSVGLSLDAVRSYSKQMFIALRHLKKHQIIHADVKPDNILCSTNLNTIKLCDLGSACKVVEAEVTPYLASRFYRAPEVILGVQPTPAIDVWSMGCVLYELYTGHILFPGATNNQMLQYMIDLRGPFSPKGLRRGRYSDKHFDLQTSTFLQQKQDPVSHQMMLIPYKNDKPRRDLHHLIRQHSAPAASTATAHQQEDYQRQIRQLADFLSNCLELDPSKRWNADQLMKHPFIAEM